MKLNCIAIDDEPLALGLVSSFIEQTPFLHLAGAFSNALDALSIMGEGHIQLVFLDIHMPELSGMEFSKLLKQSITFGQYRIIFTTAYNQFAIEGYQVDAIYYLLKPFSYQEFLKAALKAQVYFEQVPTDTTNLIPAEAREQYLFVKSDYKLVRIDFEDILFIESLKDYVKIHLVQQEKPVLSLSSLKAITEKLPTADFIRIHRSYVVAISKIDSITKTSVQIGQTTIAVGDQYRDNFNVLLARWS
ncbi:two component transcriptional regulator, LytTR family [bacterium A37T11]|nr:two component transcriptional regulator, LytTR family [bacterium A37T11]